MGALTTSWSIITKLPVLCFEGPYDAEAYIDSLLTGEPDESVLIDQPEAETIRLYAPVRGRQISEC